MPDALRRALTVARRVLTTAIALLALAGPAIAPLQAASDPAAPQLLEGPAYEKRLHALLDEATVSVDAMIYLVHLPPEAKRGQPVRRILDHLAATRRRGVAVRVIFDAGAPGGEGEDGEPVRPNLPAATALRAAGVDVRWDEDTRTTHAKAVVIDGRHCLIGSGNWTAAALRNNRELNVELDSPAVAAQFATVFEKAWKAGRPAP